MLTDEELGRQIRRQIRGKIGDFEMITDKALGAAARAVQGQSAAPEMPNSSQLDVWWRENYEQIRGISTIRIIERALRHFGLIHKVTASAATPRKQIEGMSAEKIEDEFRRAHTDQPNMFAHCAFVAHRLYNTPVAEAPDPDAEAKRLHAIAANAAQSHGYCPETWTTLTESARYGWRAVAAAKAQP